LVRVGRAWPLRPGEPARDDRANRAPLERLGDKVMPVEAKTPEGDKKISRLQRPGVDHDIPDIPASIARPDVAANRLGYPPQGEAKFLTQPAT
jgi:hypothetical protein